MIKFVISFTVDFKNAVRAPVLQNQRPARGHVRNRAEIAREPVGRFSAFVQPQGRTDCSRAPLRLNQTQAARGLQRSSTPALERQGNQGFTNNSFLAYSMKSTLILRMAMVSRISDESDVRNGPIVSFAIESPSFTYFEWARPHPSCREQFSRQAPCSCGLACQSTTEERCAQTPLSVSPVAGSPPAAGAPSCGSCIYAGWAPGKIVADIKRYKKIKREEMNDIDALTKNHTLSKYDPLKKFYDPHTTCEFYLGKNVIFMRSSRILILKYDPRT